ncbi:hypothetical protein GGS24DRAFT_329732 [Hypoxylon argillaceum]|nr:hypothetical protein GGS24DRAFT_329732 [Hypoxylon argillaceum]
MSNKGQIQIRERQVCLRDVKMIGAVPTAGKEEAKARELLYFRAKLYIRLPYHSEYRLLAPTRLCRLTYLRIGSRSKSISIDSALKYLSFNPADKPRDKPYIHNDLGKLLQEPVPKSVINYVSHSIVRADYTSNHGQHSVTFLNTTYLHMWFSLSSSQVYSDTKLHFLDKGTEFPTRCTVCYTYIRPLFGTFSSVKKSPPSSVLPRHLV